MPKFHEVEQGSGEWHKLRLGIPTASEFHKILTPTGKLSTTARKYAYRLVAEKLMNESFMAIDNLEYVARGKELEPEAIRLYEFENDIKTSPGGFITTDDGRIGASPDRMISGGGAALEVKCPAPWTHIGYLLDGFGLEYVPQAQGQLFVCQIEWVDRYSYHPRMPPARTRTCRDEVYIRKLSDALDEFCDTLDGMIERARSLGLFAERERLATQLDEYYRMSGGSRDDAPRLNAAAMRLYAPNSPAGDVHPKEPHGAVSMPAGETHSPAGHNLTDHTTERSHAIGSVAEAASGLAVGKLHQGETNATPAGDQVDDLLGGRPRKPAGYYHVTLADNPNSDDWDSWHGAITSMIGNDPHDAILRDNRTNLEIFGQFDKRHHALMRRLEAR